MAYCTKGFAVQGTSKLPRLTIASPSLFFWMFSPFTNFLPEILTEWLHLSSQHSCLYKKHKNVICCTGAKRLECCPEAETAWCFLPCFMASMLCRCYATTNIFLLGGGGSNISLSINNGFRKWPPQEDSLNYINCFNLCPYICLFCLFIQSTWQKVFMCWGRFWVEKDKNIDE